MKLRARVESFVAAARGLVFVLASQTNARIHLAATLAVVALGLFFGVDSQDWRWLGLAIALVWIAEAFNTALESLADAVHPAQHEGIGRAKDVAAGAVLVAAIAAAAIGASIFVPRILARLSGSG
jgi:diacylglycerol kinase (ATP)